MSRKQAQTSADQKRNRRSSKLFRSRDEMAEALEALLHFLDERYHHKTNSRRSSSVLGFAIERIKIEFSSGIQNIEVETKFARNAATIYLPSLPNETDEQRARRTLETLHVLLPSLKETHLRAAAHLYSLLHPEARIRLVQDYQTRTAKGPRPRDSKMI